MRPMDKWISVDDELPSHKGRFIGYDEFYGSVGEVYWDGESWWEFVDDQKDDCSITHWIPLPDPPELKDEKS